MADTPTPPAAHNPTPQRAAQSAASAGPPPAARANLLPIPATLLPEDHPDSTVSLGLASGESAEHLAAAYPAASLAWAVLAEQALEKGEAVAAYAYARTGYHRGLDALRRAGWRGQGPVPFKHGPNRGFLRALMALGQAAELIGERDEVQRIATFVAECDPSLSLPRQ
ncbi:DUF3151 domain-containing protein [Devriesea agamarum]|uniref:DUF3151 domain-containing protein n=1 Tax=Devriesea agamarum TaxID=472569 RepID=UPI000A050C04|nr:DUF3151 domain-containing protein [Devriesea agamarum]